METADGVQGDVKKFRRIEMGDAEGERRVRGAAEDLPPAECRAHPQQSAESEVSNVLM